MMKPFHVVSKAGTTTPTTKIAATAPIIGGITKAKSGCLLFGTNDKSENSHNGTNQVNHTSHESSKLAYGLGLQRPNRFTSIYSQMQQTCREEIETYARCVMLAQQQEPKVTTDNHHRSNMNTGTTYHVCAAEFAPVKECFRSVRRQLQQ
jgi:hypothetical protein